jgi:NAD/NADP transhydrogenase beta subunit
VLVTGIAFIGILVASINVFGGFTVTGRMLRCSSERTRPMNETLIQGAYIVAGLLFILALAGLSKHETAVMGNRYGIVGMDDRPGRHDPRGDPLWLATKSAGRWRLGLIAVAMAIGAAIGIALARKVEMTGMPELIAMLHSFVGLAAVLVGWNSSYETVAYPAIHDVEVFVGVFIGAVTFTGSIVAYLKLSAKMKSAPLVLPARTAQPRHHRRLRRHDDRLRPRAARQDVPAAAACWAS